MTIYLYTAPNPPNVEFKVNFRQPEVQEIPCFVISTLNNKSFIRFEDGNSTQYRWVLSSLIIEK